ncbi:signal transduction histidine kinase [Catenulispora sp. GP43]|uniref:GAF domain-containing sensor histidine kinase n=1 Tax=Catenulispora sp. GP43 TaxID=3156263 RepID=UPI003511C518
MSESSESPETADLRAALAASRRRESWLSAATDVITLMLLAEDPHDVLTLVAERARGASGADHCSLLLQHTDGSWRIDVASGLAADRVRGSLVDPHRRSVQVAVTGRPFTLEAGTAGAAGEAGTAELAPPFRRFGAIVYAALAQRDDRPIGTLVLANAPGGRSFDDEDVRLATAFAHQAGLALALTEARAAEDRLAVYADRERIARDLHDLTIQRIFAAGLSLQTLSRRMGGPDPDLPAAAERLDAVIDELDAVIAEIRTTIFDLQLTADQEATSTRARVLREASRAARVLGFEPSVRFTGPLDALVGGDSGAHLVAAVRETLANAAKHAGATRVEVVVAVEAGPGDSATASTLTLDVLDDGGAPMPRWRPSPRTARQGLTNLAARARELGGSFHAGPADGDRGTRVTWRVPLKP